MKTEWKDLETNLIDGERWTGSLQVEGLWIEILYSQFSDTNMHETDEWIVWVQDWHWLKNIRDGNVGTVVEYCSVSTLDCEWMEREDERRENEDGCEGNEWGKVGKQLVFTFFTSYLHLSTPIQFKFFLLSNLIHLKRKIVIIEKFARLDQERDK